MVKYRQECFESSGFCFNSGEQPAKYQNDLTDEKLKEKERIFNSKFNPDDYYGEWWKFYRPTSTPLDRCEGGM
ncbi:hypothetical protein ACYEXS_30495 [Paenibacillus sp. MAH-36]|uniref:hypothetical protein n=1 Tax=Paenibacillus violae TaxID=3077234 RepID=UPI0028FC2F6F|nr:hypothetical protein [Paenibacillus sp. PFR10]